MIKFSIIVPIYNVEKYLDKCLSSILNQTYTNFEVIMVNDGSTDNSQQIVNKFTDLDNRFRAFQKDNGGLSDARNFGIQYITGDYILFVDSDDYISVELLEVLDKKLNKSNIEVLGFNLVLVNDNGDIISKMEKPYIELENGEKSIQKLIQNKMIFETACSYVFKTEYWKKNNFKFDVGRFHEDFGLIPRIIFTTNYFSSICYDGYYYFQSNNSITRNNSYSKTKKKVYDTLFHYDNLIIESNNIKNKKTKKYFQSYISNAVISKIYLLNSNDKNTFALELKKRKVTRFLLEDKFLQKLKKLKISLYLFMKGRK